jgi:hypothetical protein
MLSCLNVLIYFIGVFPMCCIFVIGVPKVIAPHPFRMCPELMLPKVVFIRLQGLSITIVLVSCVVPTQGYGACCQV